MKEDPIVEELHLIREELLKECGGDMEKLMDRLRLGESEKGERIASMDELKARARSKTMP
ncbi:MAG: hypothetical protein ACE5JI_13400 [Acidobacteriota bacterium]